MLKGVQTAADARKAVDYGVEGILLSNHGGRSLDTTQPAMLTLLEIHKVCVRADACLITEIDMVKNVLTS